MSLSFCCSAAADRSAACWGAAAEAATAILPPATTGMRRRTTPPVREMRILTTQTAITAEMDPSPRDGTVRMPPIQIWTAMLHPDPEKNTRRSRVTARIPSRSWSTCAARIWSPGAEWVPPIFRRWLQPSSEAISICWCSREAAATGATISSAIRSTRSIR